MDSRESIQSIHIVDHVAKEFLMLWMLDCEFLFAFFSSSKGSFILSLDHIFFSFFLISIFFFTILGLEERVRFSDRAMKFSDRILSSIILIEI